MKDPDKRWRTMGEFTDSLSEWLVSHGTTEDIAGNPVVPLARRMNGGVRDPLSSFPPRANGGVRDPLSSFPPPPALPRISQQTTTVGLSEAPWRKRRAAILVSVAVAAALLGFGAGLIRVRMAANSGPGEPPIPSALPATLPEPANIRTEPPKLGQAAVQVAPTAVPEAASPRTVDRPRKWRPAAVRKSSKAPEIISEHATSPQPLPTATVERPKRKLRDPFEE